MTAWKHISNLDWNEVTVEYVCAKRLSPLSLRFIGTKISKVGLENIMFGKDQNI